MNKINIQKATGFPVRKKTFDFLQEAYGNAIAHLCKAYGDNLILHGVELAGAGRTAGAIIVNGELLPFIASLDGEKILIEETIESDEYKGGELLPAYYTRVAKCSPIGTVDMANLKRIKAAQTNWVNCTPTADIVVTGVIQCRISETGKVELRGKYHHVDNALFYDFALPAGFIPAKNRVSAVQMKTGVKAVIPLYIPTDGHVRAAFGDFGVYDFELDCEFDL
jgi:hypothetical protein